MPTEKTTGERITMEQAIQRLSESYINMDQRVTRLEGNIIQLITQLESKIDCIIQSNVNRFEEMREQLSNRIDQVREQISNRIDQIQTETSEWHIKTTQKMNQFEKERDESLQRAVLIKDACEGQSFRQEISNPNNDHLFLTNANLVCKTQVNFAPSHEDSSTPKNCKTLMPHAIVIPPTAAIPTFSGKFSERPNQFLIRVQEYAETVHGWDQHTLLLGISQFLRENALEWYCQLRASFRRPETWTEFVKLFLSQFNSPIRNARQEQEWYECKQKENETINEFLVRLRAIWKEQKPKETEVDLVKHLLCKMRSDLLSMIGVSRGATLDEIIIEAQKVEEILYRREKEQRRREYLKQTSTETAKAMNQSNDYINSPQRRNNNINTVSNRYDGSQYQKYKNLHNDKNAIQQMNSIKCQNCGLYGHFSKNCPSFQAYKGKVNSSNYDSKNE